MNIKLVDSPKKANAITHGGTFHADDVFSSIFLAKILGKLKLYRTNIWQEEYNQEGTIIFDIGLGVYDHHGKIARIRQNGIKYSAFGLLFEKYGKEYLKKLNVEDEEYTYNIFLKEFIIQIDAIDNGIFPSNPKDYIISSLSTVIELFNKTWLEEQTDDEAFLNAIMVGNLIFERIEKRIIDKLKARKEVENAITSSQNNILYLEKYMPFMDFVLESNQEKAKKIYFAIYPSNRGGYNIRAINKEIKNHENRCDFPKEWGGKTQEELIKITQVKTIRFCHANLFLCTCDTLSDAFKIAEKAIFQKNK